MRNNHLFYILKLLRVRQWIKNIALFASITFSGQLFNLPVLGQVFIGFVAFCFLSSATYIINDALDLKKDRLHPFKKSRPLASGKISMFEAFILFLVLLAVAFSLSLFLNPLFFTIVLIYIILQICYSFVFKSMVIFDILFIATGYILRVFAGEVISGLHISVWLLLTTVSLSLFLAVGKRRSELTLLKNIKETRIEEIRSSLSHYSERLLDTFTAMFATSTFVFYSMFTYLEDPHGVRIANDVFLPDFLPTYLQKKWLMITIIPVIYGIMKYLQDIYEKGEGESPDRVILTDKSLLVSVILWVVLVVTIIYFISDSM